MKHKCVDCGQELKEPGSKRCWPCATKASAPFLAEIAAEDAEIEAEEIARERKIEWFRPLMCSRCGELIGWTVFPPEGRIVCDKCVDEEDRELTNDWGTLAEAEARST